MARSPGVYTFERDLSQNTKTIGLTAGGFAGSFNWGPIDEVVNVVDEDEVLFYYGKPDDVNYVDWLSAVNFLNYTGNLNIIRVSNANAKNATSGSAGVLIKNSQDFEIKQSTLTEHFYAKYAGDLGNSISVHAADSATFTGWAYEDEFDTAPGSSEYSETFVANALDEMHLVVVDTAGYITGIPGAILEKYAYLSKAKDSKDINNQASYYKTVINTRSPYIYVGEDIGGALVDTTDATKGLLGTSLLEKKVYVSFASAIALNLTDGANGGLGSKTDYINAFTEICESDNAEVGVVFAGGAGGDANVVDMANLIGSKCKESQLRVGFTSPKISDVVGVADKNTILNNIITTADAITEKHSYLSMATGVKMVYDKYNSVNRWIPTNSDEAGVWARIHNNEGKWVSAGGYNKGVYTNVVRLAYNPSLSHRSKFDAKNINNVIQESGEGVLLLGDKTMQGKNSAFSYLGTRFLFIAIKNIIVDAAKYTLFEFNNEFTRSQFRDLVEPFLRDIKGQRGLHDFKVVCDESNNTPKVIQDGKFKGNVFIKPEYSIQTIDLIFAPVNRTLKFEEVVRNV